jgi:6-pyruvoyltetrahydropterin/6-carboxytetrahydropterin synthase
MKEQQMKRLKFAIEKEVEFSAHHVLEGLEEGHQCGRDHGHNYTVVIRLVGDECVQPGWLFDFGVISAAIKGRYDHRSLNKVMRTNPTAENVAVDILNLINELLFRSQLEQTVSVERVIVKETRSSLAEVIVYDDGQEDVLPIGRG